MSSQKTISGLYGPGTFVDAEFHGVPAECRRLLPYLLSTTPGLDLADINLDDIEFFGDDLPAIPGPLKSQVLSSILHAMIGIVCKQISSLKGHDAGKIRIDTDACGLFPATVGLVNVDGKSMSQVDNLSTVGVDLDKKCVDQSPLTYRTWAIYPTKDPLVHYQILGNMAPLKFLKTYGIDPTTPVNTNEEAYEFLKSHFSKYSAPELEVMNMKHGFCGQTCFTPQEWRETTMAKSLAVHPLINCKQVFGATDTPPVPFPQSDDHRPLAGIKVLELARVIAGPAIATTLASLGAEVIKVQSPTLPDLQPLALSLTAGKKTVGLDLNNPADKQHLHELIESADVIVQAFRYRSLERKGFGLDYAVELARKRGKGVVYCDLNTYGPDGYYAERPGFQQIADAASGCSYVIGKSLRREDGAAVLPPLPIADMLAGAVGVVEVLIGLRDRAIKGGSYHAFSALTSVDTIQVSEEFGLYSQETVDKIQAKYKFEHMGPEHHVLDILRVILNGWSTNSDLLSRSNYMTTFKTAWGEKHSILAPILKFDNPSVCPRWDHGPVPYCMSEREAWA